MIFDPIMTDEVLEHGLEVCLEVVFGLMVLAVAIRMLAGFVKDLWEDWKDE